MILCTRLVLLQKGDKLIYKKLSSEYFSQYKALKNYISNLRIQLKRSINEVEAEKLKQRIYILYNICLDLKHTSEYLKKCERRDYNANK